MKTILKSTEIETKSERQMESVNRAELFRQIGRAGGEETKLAKMHK